MADGFGIKWHFGEKLQKKFPLHLERRCIKYFYKDHRLFCLTINSLINLCVTLPRAS